jgi:hypothetical protein
MAKNPNIIYFSLPEKTRQKLSDLGNGEESISLVAKRLLLSALGEDNEATIPDDTAKALGDRLQTIEQFLWDKDGLVNRQDQILPFVDSIKDDYGDQLAKMGDRLAKIETLLEQKADTALTLKALNHLESAINSPQETAIMIQKKHLDSVPTEITLEHADMAAEFDRTTATIKKWSKNPDHWPEGFIFDGDRQFWVKTA